MSERRRPFRRGRGPRPSSTQISELSGEPNPYRDSDNGVPGDGANVAVEAPGRDAGGGPAPAEPAGAPADDTVRPTRGRPRGEGRKSPRGEPRGDGRGDGRAADGRPAEGRAPEPRAERPPREPREPRESRESRDGRERAPEIRNEPRGDARNDARNEARIGRGEKRGDTRDRRPARGDGRNDGAGRGRHPQPPRRGRGRGAPAERPERVERPLQPVAVEEETGGWFDTGRDGGYIRRPENSYLADPGDAWVPPQVMREHALRRGDAVVVGVGRDQRGRWVVSEVRSINGRDATVAQKRPDFSSLTAAYPDRRLTLETGKPAKGGPELTRRAIDLIAPIGYGQRALIVAPARAGKTMLLHAITEGIATNHPDAVLLILLVDERPEEVTEAQSWGVGEVVASSFDQPADRHVDVAEMVLERSRRLVEMGQDVVIVLDSLTRLARAHNTAERGTGRTLSGGLDATAMAKPKAFFGSARAVADTAGGGSLTIIATALVETGSRMDDVIFEEFKGTGNCEIKLDRSLAEKRIYPAFDVAVSGTRREDKLFRPEQMDAVFTLRRGLQQMPPAAGMEWLIKRIGNTPNNDTLLAGL